MFHATLSTMAHFTFNFICNDSFMNRFIKNLNVKIINVFVSNTCIPKSNSGISFYYCYKDLKLHKLTSVIQYQCNAFCKFINYPPLRV